jgi:hypothetical protein
MSLSTIGAILADYDNGYTLPMLRDKYKISEAYALDIICKRLGI